ncbi:hypothetical protein ABL78_1196 [Leptomonas seymouri]|uniref:Uncharacterized protein n=1 Tax=Leptomonas seymouri TaxID=5684 RepID=A0A0N1I2K8_LEPSE|nr:hypothetical protein ABL78_1196 [Leptomonas seymouri]|eukprot:KPI89703.1 hypothetical protein ABL78_1196 [Leptomonas seymouri]
MYKQRDNEYYPPMTSDPSGSGIVSSTLAAPSNAINSDDSTNINAFAGPAVAAGSRKRGRDIRGLERFRSVVYGENGFRRLHAMAERNPILMYPPEGIEEARARVADRQREAQERRQQQLQPCSNPLGGDKGEEDVFALFEERRAAEEQQDTLPGTALPEGASAEPSAPLPQRLASLAALRNDEALAKSHHKQLDSFLRLVYELNHVSFVKLPMEDTLQLLSRCGKEAVAHVVEYETQLRLKRQARLRELAELQEEKNKLAKRRMAVEEAEEARLLAAAEQRQAELELLEPDHTTDQQPSADGSVEVRSMHTRAASPQVHFAFDEKVKEEADVKETDLVQTVVRADRRLPVVGEDEGNPDGEHNDEHLLGISSSTPALDAHPPTS